MKVRVVRSYIDKYTLKDIDKGTELDVTEERFSELTAGPRGVFVEEIKEDGENLNKMTKAELIDYAKSLEIELTMEMTKDEMVNILHSK